MSPAEIDRYVARQIWDIRQHRGNPKLRRQAADNLKVLGPEAVAAVFDLANAVLKDVDTEVKRTAIEALGEIGMPKGIWYVRNGAQIRTIYEYDSSGAVSYAGHPAIGALVQTLLKTEDPDLGIAAEDALVKLLPTVRKRLTMDDAILLWQVQASGNKRVAPAIESAMAIFQVAQEAIAKEANKRRLQELRDAEYWAKEDERRRLAGLPTREELLLGARARREEMLSGPQESSSRGDGRVKWPDEPPYRNPLKRNANGTYNN
jgi:HEAT repeat protein